MSGNQKNSSVFNGPLAAAAVGRLRQRPKWRSHVLCHLHRLQPWRLLHCWCVVLHHVYWVGSHRKHQETPGNTECRTLWDVFMWRIFWGYPHNIRCFLRILHQFNEIIRKVMDKKSMYPPISSWSLGQLRTPTWPLWWWIATDLGHWTQLLQDHHVLRGINTRSLPQRGTYGGVVRRGEGAVKRKNGEE